MMDIYYHHFVFAKTTSYFIAGGDTRDLYSLVREALSSWCTDVTQSVSFPFLSVELCQSACSSSPGPGTQELPWSGPSNGDQGDK